MAQTRVPLAIVGGGNMAQAIVRGGLDSSILTLSQVAVAEPEPERRDVFRAWGVRAVKTPEELATWLRAHEPPDKLGNVLLAVKPQNLAAAGAQYARLLAGPAPRCHLDPGGNSNSSRAASARIAPRGCARDDQHACAGKESGDGGRARSRGAIRRR
jgi:hypothetical protein